MHLPDIYDNPQDAVLDELVIAALRGWTPADLYHTLGPRISPFLRAARPRIPDTVHARIAAAWDRQLNDGTRTTVGSAHGTLPSLALDLACLPAFSDSDLYADRHTLLNPGLSPEQRRATQRITGLLRKARSTTFAAEAESLVAKAQQLRQRYRLEHALDDGPGDVVSVRVHLCAPWVRFQFLLFGSVAFPNSCRTVLSGSIGIATLLGHPDDVRHCLELFASLNHQRDYFMRHSPGAAAAARRGQTSAYRRSFLFAYATRIRDLLDTATTTTPADREAAGTALPVLARRGVSTEKIRDRIFPHTSGMRFGHNPHNPGVADGIAAAERSHLGPARSGLNSA